MIKDYAPEPVYITRESWPGPKKLFGPSKGWRTEESFASDDESDEIELLPQEQTNQEKCR